MFLKKGGGGEECKTTITAPPSCNTTLSLQSENFCQICFIPVEFRVASADGHHGRCHAAGSTPFGCPGFDAFGRISGES